MKSTLTPKEKYLIGNYILAHCSIPDGSQYAKWDAESGGGDITATERLRAHIPNLTVCHVRYLRQKFDLPLEPPRLVFVRPPKNDKPTDLELMHDKIEALTAHIKSCDIRLKDQETRITALEDRYTNPKAGGADPDLFTISYRDRIDCERSAATAVARVIDPLIKPPPRPHKSKGRRR